MRTANLCFVLLLMVFHRPVLADETAWSQVFEDTTEVQVANVEVFVTDKDGNPVTGLTAEDFGLTVGGDAIDIANFYAIEEGEALSTVTGSASPPEDREFLLVFYIDNANMDPNGRKRVFNRLKKFLLANWRPDMRVMLATNERTVMVRQSVTEVPHLVFVALDEIEETQAAGLQLQQEKREITRAIREINVDAASGFVAIKDPSGDEGGGTERELALNSARAVIPQMRSYAQQRLDRTLESLGVLRGFVNTVGGLPGRKALIYVGDELALRPGDALFELFSRQIENISELANFSSMSESFRYDASPQFRELVNHANASQVTLHVLDATRPSVLGRDTQSASNVVWTPQVASLEEGTRRDSKLMLVQGTGGRANFGSTDFETVLEGMVSDFDNHYSLGYLVDSVPKAEDDKALPVEVTLKEPRKDWEVRHRKTFQKRSTDDEMKQQVLSALILDSFENPMGAGLEVREQTSREDGNFEVPLLVKVPLGKLVLLPQGKQHRARVSLYVAVRDGRGRSSRVVKHQCPISIPNDEMLVALGRTAACGMKLAMRGGPHTVAVVVRDDVAGLESTLRAGVDVRLVEAAELEAEPESADEGLADSR